MNKSSSLPSPHSANPARLGYRMPAEWEPHEATWLSWPYDEKTWPHCDLDRIRDFFCQLVSAIVDDEIVHINVADEPMERSARKQLSRRSVDGDIRFHRIPTNDAWCRDHAAIVVTNRQNGNRYPTRVAIDWGTRVGGNPHPNFDRNNAVPAHMAREIQIPCIAGGMNLEGGSIEVNGKGDLLTTESRLRQPQRDPKFTRAEMEKRLSDLLGVSNIIWLAHGIQDNEVGGHVDDVARFVDASRVVTVWEPDPCSANYQPLQENLGRLESARLKNGQPVQVAVLPLPSPIVHESNLFPASYANYYVTNHSVLVPTFDQPSDAEALESLSRLFPNRRVVGLDCVDVIVGRGAIHCWTQQIPAA